MKTARLSSTFSVQVDFPSGYLSVKWSSKMVSSLISCEKMSCHLLNRRAYFQQYVKTARISHLLGCSHKLPTVSFLFKTGQWLWYFRESLLQLIIFLCLKSGFWVEAFHAVFIKHLLQRFDLCRPEKDFVTFFNELYFVHVFVLTKWTMEIKSKECFVFVWVVGKILVFVILSINKNLESDIFKSRMFIRLPNHLILKFGWLPARYPWHCL